MNRFTATPEERRTYQEKGFFIRERVFSEPELDVLRRAVDRIHEDMETVAASADAPPVKMVDDKRHQDIRGSCVKWEWQDGARDIRSMEPFLHLHPDLAELIDDPRLWAPVAPLLDEPELSLFTDKLNFKRPGGAPFPWHQDSPYFYFGCAHVHRLVSLQLYLDDATRDNGCLWMIPGSHQTVHPTVQDKGALDRLYTNMDVFSGEEPRPIEVPAGSVIYFHTNVVHGSKGNHTNDARRAMVITYQPAGHPMWRLPGDRPVKASPV